MRECSTCKRCFPDDVNVCPEHGTVTLHSFPFETVLDGRYQLEERLGQGSMGVVFRARHIFLKTAHAIKIILPDLVGNDPSLVTRFRQEAMVAARIRHHNIVAVTDFGVIAEQTPFLVMEYIHGQSLHDSFLAEGAVPLVRALQIFEPICAGVASAHRLGIIHRDLKPLNIMIAYDEPINEALKLLDFGLAKIKSGDLLGSFIGAKTSGLMGSPFYMAPEQWSDEDPDARADIYSLGVILYQMLTGEVPFKGSSIPAIMKKHLTEDPPNFASHGIKLPPGIGAVIFRALEKDREKRTPTVDTLIQELRVAIATDLPSVTQKPTPLQLRSDPSAAGSGKSSSKSVGSPTAEPAPHDGKASEPGLKSVFRIRDETIAPAPKAPDVFICYASEDAKIAEAICEALEAKDIDCWIAPRNVLPGMSYAKAIINALKASRVMVLLFSSQSNNSPQVIREVERAASMGMPIIPFRIEVVPLSDDMQFYVSSPHWYDAITPPLEKHLHFLALSVRLHLRMSNEMKSSSLSSGPLD